MPTRVPPPPPPLLCTHHLLSLAEADVLARALGTGAGLVDVHVFDEWHGGAAQQQDGEEHDNDGGGADELSLLKRLQL